MFREIYGSYYFMLEKILALASGRDITRRDIDRIVAEYGFQESGLYFTGEAVAQQSGYRLLVKTPAGYRSALADEPAPLRTNEQERFLKTMLADRRIRLFLSDGELEEASRALEGVEPLFDPEDFVLTETSSDGDPYESEAYRARFQRILGAVQARRLLKIVFDSSAGERHTFTLAPYKLEYGLRDDKFRLCGVSFRRGRPVRYVKINLARMDTVAVLEQVFSLDFEEFIRQKRRGEPIEIEVTDERNGIERVFIGLSGYERVSAFHGETGTCTMKIFYPDDEEPELLILLLSFGPVVRVLGPAGFRERVAERVRRQADLFRDAAKRPEGRYGSSP